MISRSDSTIARTAKTIADVSPIDWGLSPNLARNSEFANTAGKESRRTSTSTVQVYPATRAHLIFVCLIAPLSSSFVFATVSSPSMAMYERLSTASINESSVPFRTQSRRQRSQNAGVGPQSVLL
jgi:hypothetical protein